MSEERSRERLNPFVFPSETALRTALLICAILGLCWNVGFFYAKVLAATLRWPAVDARPSPSMDILDVYSDEISPTPEVLARDEQALSRALAGLDQPQARAQALAALERLALESALHMRTVLPYFLIPTLFLLLAAFVIAAFYLARALRLRSLRPLTDSSRKQEPEFHDAIDLLVEEARTLERERGLEPFRLPKVLISPGHRGDGQAYGVFRRPVIVLPRSLRLFLRKDLEACGKPRIFRALLFHELAHFANRDVASAYWAQASWIILILVLSLMIVSTTLLWFDLGGQVAPSFHPVLVSCQVAVSLLVIELIRRSLLRDREHYADVRVALLWRAGEPLRSMLDRKAPGSPAPRRGLARSLAGLWRRHPGMKERQEVLEDSGRLFETTPDLPFLAGLLFGNLLLTSFVLAGMLTLLVKAMGTLVILEIVEKYAQARGLANAIHLYYRLVPLLGPFLLVSFVGFAMAGSYMLAGTLGLQVQRESVLQILRHRRGSHPYRALLVPAFLAAAGFEIGWLLVPMMTDVPATLPGWLAVFLWVIFATFPFWLWLATIRFFARRIFGTHLGNRQPVWQTRILTLSATLLLWFLSAALLSGQAWISPRLDLKDGTGAVLIGAGILGLGAFLVLGALMLFALGVRQVRQEGRRRPCCASCHRAPSRITVAARCDFCGQVLAPWLLIEPPRDAQEEAA